MPESIDNKILELTQESLNEFESPKGSIANAIKKLKRAAELLEYKHIVAWCELQLGTPTHVLAARNYIDSYVKYSKSKNEADLMKIAKSGQELTKLGFKIDSKESMDEINAELTHKANEGSGGLESIGFIEERYNELVRTKKGNDTVYYKFNLGRHLNLIKENGHKKATFINNQILFKEAPRTSFDYLKAAVDDRLLDLSPELAEQLMIAFKSLSTNSKEELSQSLTTCRRIIEKFADIVFPPKEELHKGRKVGKTQYINRLWAFIDSVVESESNKNIAHTHLEYLGQYLEATHKLSHKGVHAEVTKLEAIKSVFHLYLIFADLLEYLKIDVTSNGKIDINKATIDELEVLGNLKRNIAKEIVKARIEFGRLTEKKLLSIKGIGNKTILNLKEKFDI